ncbi:hypothetical protein [Caballeronia fortuita]|uniref:hypothetical protein n=1 Tax=Caballeronia fortuita TaxID=1777138 RepID=UPI0012FDB19C|nr:hypothetical protein [Caballeronia fortuita]
MVKLKGHVEYFSHLNLDNEPVFGDAVNHSILNWPDGRLCFPVTAFLQQQAETSCSTAIDGSTVRTKAYHLSHLVRFCYKSQTDFADLTNAQMMLFSNNMLVERKIPGHLDSAKVRNGSVPFEICRDCLDFLEYIGEIHGMPNFVSKNGQIRAERVTKTHTNPTTGLSITYRSWVSEILPERGEVRTRQAISDEVRLKLTSAVPLVIDDGYFDIYRKRRLHVSLRLLRILGCRRTELVLLKVADFECAARMLKPKIEVVTLKHKKTETRFVEINQVDIREVLNFAKIFRSAVIEATCGKANDDGYLLISSRSGRKLKGNTVTQLLGELRSAADVPEQACAHMFRNLFIVERLCILMEHHQILNKDAFKRALIDQHTLLKEVMKETGQTSMQTVLRYLEGAEAKLAKLDATKMSVRADLLEQSLQRAQEQHKLRLLEGVSELVSLRILQDAVDAARQEASDLARSAGRTK